ncbi:hypothetical protein GF389_02585 [Candidatus Dojkabacteria bacterium]|nr:hypothetical protein [Candidatus Dojkabacteria bacterium]
MRLHYERAKKDITEREQIQKKAQTKLTNLQSRKKRLDELLETGVYNVEKYDNRMIDIESKIAVEMAKIDDIRMDIDEDTAEVNLGLDYLQRLSKLWISLPVESKQKLTRYLFPEGIIFENGKLTTTEKSILLGINELSTDLNSNLVTLVKLIAN